jgi:hypothetical protein
MKKYLLTASLIAGLSMIAAPAMAQATGHVGASFGNINLDVGGLEDDANVYGVDGTVSFPVGTGLLLQGNLAYGNVDGDGIETSVVRGSANLGFRNDQWAAGAYVGASSNEDADSNGFYFGGEYLFYMPQFTFSAGVGVANYDDSDVDGTGIQGEGRYFATDNFRIDGRIGYLKYEDVASIDGFGFGIGAEWKPDGMPVSFFASADMQNLEADGGGELDFTTLAIGARFDFGSGTLKARDRSGPAFRPMAGLDGGPGQFLF